MMASSPNWQSPSGVDPALRLPGEIPLVAAIMPAFNAERTILEAVQSVLDQTYPHLELIVCDDGSSDGTATLLEALDTPRLRVVRNPVNEGAGPARDRAIALTSAPWVAFIDADDTWHPERISRLMQATNLEHDVIAFDDIMLCHDAIDGMIPWRPLRGRSAFGTKGKSPRSIDTTCFVTATRMLMQPLISTTLIQRHRVTHTNRGFGEDIEFILRLIAHRAKLTYVPDALYFYRISPGSVTDRAGDRGAMRECLQDCLKLEGHTPEVRNALQSKIESLQRNEKLYALVDLIRSGRLIEASRTFLRNPRLLIEFAARLVHTLAYDTHRILHRGRRRGLPRA